MQLPSFFSLRAAAFCVCAALFSAAPAAAQTRATAVVEGGDTVLQLYLPEVVVKAQVPPRLRAKHAAVTRLRRNVQKVYPYAVTAAGVLKDVDVTLARLEGDRRGRKAYMKSVEAELNKRFKGELENLTITQGQILAKLIDRQTGKPCFTLIQELKGGFSAVMWQSVALLFSQNLKREYDPTGRDREIEGVVQELEEKALHDYRYQMQTRR